MDLVWIIYLIEVLSDIGTWVSVTIGITIAALVCLGIGVALAAAAEEAHEYVAFVKPGVKLCAWVLVVTAVIDLLVPGKTAMYTMIAAYGGQQVAESQAVQSLAPKSLELLEKYMDKHLKELGQPSE